MQAFARTLDAIDFANCERADTDTALIVSSYLDTQYPFTSPDSHVAVAKSLHQAYISARLADLPPQLTRETTGIEPGARLYLAPSVKQILAPTAARARGAGERRRDRLRLLLRRRRVLAPRPVLRDDERACSA